MNPEPNPDLDPASAGPRGTKRYETRAAKYLSDASKARSLLDHAERKGGPAAALKRIWDDTLALLRMVRAYVDGRYRPIPWRTVLTATAAIVYFAAPTDFIPDFILGLGLLDDAAVLTWTISAVGKSLAEFRAWEAAQRSQVPDAPDSSA